MLLADDTRRYVDANEAACSLLHCERDWLIGKRVDDLSAEVPTDVSALWASFLEVGTQSGRFTLRRADDSEVEVNYSATARIAPNVHLSVMVPAGEESELEIASAPAVHVSSAQLSDREREVMTLLALGTTASEIAESLVISKETVRNHLRNARAKLGARTRAQAIAVALRRGEIDV